MEETFNRVIRTEEFKYIDAIKIAYQCVREKKLAMDEVDIHNQGLSEPYQLTMLALEQMFLREPEQITNNL